MNTPNPLVPQGTFPDKGRSHVRITVFAILAVHLVLLGVLLIAGCNKKAEQAQDAAGNLPSSPTPGEPWPTSPPPPQVTQDLARATPPTPVPDAGATPPAPPADLAPSGFTEHTIAKGDSFYTLGKAY